MRQSINGLSCLVVLLLLQLVVHSGAQELQQKQKNVKNRNMKESSLASSAGIEYAAAIIQQKTGLRRRLQEEAEANGNAASNSGASQGGEAPTDGDVAESTITDPAGGEAPTDGDVAESEGGEAPTNPAAITDAAGGEATTDEDVAESTITDTAGGEAPTDGDVAESEGGEAPTNPATITDAAGGEAPTDGDVAESAIKDEAGGEVATGGVVIKDEEGGDSNLATNADGENEENSRSEEAADGVATAKDESETKDDDDTVYPQTILSPPSYSDMKDVSFEEITMTTCQKIDFAVAYLTSLEFNGTIVKNSKSKTGVSMYWSDIYYIEMVVLPTSLILAFFGSSLLLPASMLAAASMGTFLVFHVSGTFGGWGCKLKLCLSSISAGVCATLAMKFVRFGLFTLGSFSAGIASYMFFDAFPAFDPGTTLLSGMKDTLSNVTYFNSVIKHSDVSPVAWAIILVLASISGCCVRAYEQASVEVLTALMGGAGTGFAIHSHTLVHGHSMNRSMAFMLAGIVCIFGCRFQRRRRLGKSVAPMKKDDSLPQYSAFNGASWKELQKSIDATNAILKKTGNNDAAQELSGLLHNFQSNIKEGGKDN